jgi:hypothetical protein
VYKHQATGVVRLNDDGEELCLASTGWLEIFVIIVVCFNDDEAELSWRQPAWLMNLLVAVV